MGNSNYTIQSLDWKAGCRNVAGLFVSFLLIETSNVVLITFVVRYLWGIIKTKQDDRLQCLWITTTNRKNIMPPPPPGLPLTEWLTVALIITAIIIALYKLRK